MHAATFPSALRQRFDARVIPPTVAMVGSVALLLQIAAYDQTGRTKLWFACAGWTTAAAAALIGTVFAVFSRPRVRRGHWLLLAAASGAWLAGQLLWDVEAAVRHFPPAFSVADVLWWLFAVLASVALFDLGTAKGRRRVAVLEAFPLTLGGSAAIVALLYGGGGLAPISPAAKASAMGYPAFYCCLGVVTLQALVTAGRELRRDRAFVLLAGGLLAETVAFCLWGPEVMTGTFTAGTGPLDLLWSGGLVAIAVAGCIPPAPFVRDTRAQDRLGGFLPASCFFVVTAMLVYNELTHHDRRVRLLLELALCGAGAALVVRGWLLTRRQAGLLEREAGATQELTRLYSNLQSVLCSAGEGIWGLDADGRITFVNPAAEEMLGYTAAEMLGRSSHELAHHSHADGEPYLQESCPILRSLREGTANRVHGEVFWRKDGTSFPVDYTSTPIVEEGEVRGVVLVFRDVTESLRLETQLRQSQRLEAIGRLSGGVAHDFNNILTAISGYSELIRRNVSGVEVTKWLDGTAVAIDRAADLTRQLLAFSRQQVMERRVHALNDVVEANDMLLRRLIREDIQFAVELDASAPNVEIDAAQVGQVLMNLVVNARDAMPHGGTIRVSTGTVDFRAGAQIDDVPIPAGRYAHLSIADTGEGMSAEVARHVFDPFFTTKLESGGTGLGLATAYGIVKQSGGFIFVASHPGRGTSFDIYLPATTAEPFAEPEPEPLEPGEDAGLVLLVEDEDVVRMLLADALGSAGYEVLLAADGEQAVELARTYGKRIELLVTDVIMPGGSGRRVADVVREEAPHARVIFMSGYAQDVLDDPAEQRFAFLQKPFPLDALRAKAAELLTAA